MNRCPRPLDSIDVEALAAGAEPVRAADAAEHAEACASCGERVREAAALTRSLEGSDSEPLESAVDLASRILRVRPFSSRERRRFTIWRGPISLAALLFVAGVLLLAVPGITAREQASLGIAAVAPLLAILRASVRAIAEILSTTPAGIAALSEVLRGEKTVGAVALLLLLPAGLGLSRALARAKR